jgi:hypothetical protein
MLGNKKFFVLSFVLSALATPALRADFITVSQPTSSYVSGTTLADFTDPDFTLVNSISAGGLTLSYDTTIDERTVPDSWGTWNNPPAVETATPRVGTTDGPSTLTITFSKALSTFGLEIEPDNFASENITANYYSGSNLIGTISLSPDGNGGALLYAASTSTNPFTSVVITNTTGDDFAFGRQRFALAAGSVPEPSTYTLAGAGLLLVALAFRRARKA